MGSAQVRGAIVQHCSEVHVPSSHVIFARLWRSNAPSEEQLKAMLLPSPAVSAQVVGSLVQHCSNLQSNSPASYLERGPSHMMVEALETRCTRSSPSKFTSGESAQSYGPVRRPRQKA